MPRTSACNSEPAYKPGRCWAWVTVWLLLAGMLGVFGLSGAPSGVPTPVNQSSAQSTKRPLRAKPIENIQLGERLSGRNPLREDVDPALPDPDPATWRQVKLQMIKPSGKRAEIEFLWP
ncbi:MAG: hypothetical protein U1E05_20225, partial [Patescibacteria group bacterium]|nr:hypothetical protein [Patescibacteria group bacterium]